MCEQVGQCMVCEYEWNTTVTHVHGEYTVCKHSYECVCVCVWVVAWEWHCLCDSEQLQH